MIRRGTAAGKDMQDGIMIASMKSYKVTQEELAILSDALTRERAALPRDGEDPVLRAARLRGLEVQAAALSDEIAAYEALREGRVRTMSVQSFADMRNLLISARVAAGLTQRDLAQRLHLKEQQIQR